MTNESRINMHTSIDKVYINCSPYKSLKYALMLILYITLVGLSILGIIYWKVIFNFSGEAQKIFSFYIGAFICCIAIFLFPLFLSVFKNSLFRNFFFHEHFSIEDGKIEYRNNFGKKISYKMSHIKWIYFEFSKSHRKFLENPPFVSNYAPTIFLMDQNKKIVAKTMFSINKEEIQNIHKVILECLLKGKNFYLERNVDYEDKIRRERHWGKEIEFVSVFEFFHRHMSKFSIEERCYYNKLLEQQIASEDELTNALLSKFSGTPSGASLPSEGKES